MLHNNQITRRKIENPAYLFEVRKICLGEESKEHFESSFHGDEQKEKNEILSLGMERDDEENNISMAII